MGWAKVFNGNYPKSLFKQDFDEINKGIVNSEMYKRQALHFSAKKQFEQATKYLSLGKLGIT